MSTHTLSYTVEGLLPEPVFIAIRDELTITEDLDSEVDQAAQTFGYYGVLSEKAETRYQKLKFAYEVWRAELESRTAKERELGGEKKLTEAQMEALVGAEPKYQSYQLKLIELDEHRRILKVIAKAFEIKKDLVQTKCANRRKEIQR